MNLPQRERLGLTVSLMLAVFCFFWPVLDNGFVDFDDPYYVTANPLVKDLSPGVLGQNLLSLHRGHYKPVAYAAFALEYHWFGLSASGYHAVSIVLHALNTLLVFWLFLSLGLSPLMAWFIGVLFGLHPLRVESVAWITEQKDLLYGFFFLAAALGYVLARKARSRAAYYGGLVCFFLSLAAKPVMLAGPVIFIAIDLIFFNQKFLKSFIRALPFFIVSIAVGLADYLALLWGDRYHVTQLAPIDLSALLPRIFFYLSKIFWPANLSAIYPIGTESEPGYFIGGLGVIALFLVYGLASRAWKILVFGFTFFLVSAAVVLLIGGNRFAVADRYLYIAGIGIFYIIAQAVRSIKQGIGALERFPGKAIFLVSGGCLLGAMAALTFQQCFFWRNGHTLWNSMARQFPRSSFVGTGLGFSYLSAGDISRACRQFGTLLESDPARWENYYGMGLCLLRQGRYEEARVAFEQGLRLKPDIPEYYNGLALQAMEREDPDFRQALDWARRALQIDPMHDMSWFNAGLAYFQMEAFNGAQACFERSRKLNPDNPSSWLFLADIQTILGHETEALEICSRAMKKFPTSGEVHVFAGKKLVHFNRIDEARQVFKKALKLAPDSEYVVKHTGDFYRQFGE